MNWVRNNWLGAVLVSAGLLVGAVAIGYLLLPGTQPVLVEDQPVRAMAELVRGAPMTAAGFQALATDDECAAKPIMLDHRSSDDPSLGILRRLNEGDFAYAQTWAGFQVADLYGCRRATTGQKYLDLYAVELKCGPAVLQPMVLDQNGAPKSGTLIFLNWPDMGDASVFPPEGVDPPYYSEGTGGFTDSGGSVGFGFGPGSQLAVGEGGPFNTWGGSDPVSWPDRVVGSDALTKVGWFDNHCVFNSILKITRKEGNIPPPASVGVRLAIMENGEVLGYILPSTEPAEPGFSGLELQDEAGAPVWRVPSVDLGE